MMEEIYMVRCFTLAQKASKGVKSNPNVGAVLVYKDRIIGEGFHEEYGKEHAEVMAVQSVKEDDRNYIPHSTLYVSLEPCCISAKTPACTDLILRSGIKKVVIACQDPNPLVAGKGIKILEANGVHVTTGILEEDGQSIIEPFLMHLQKQPFVTLKWAKSKDHFMGQKDRQVWLSNEFSKTFAHKLRAENDAILIGTNTALVDNPRLTTRLVKGDHPLRVVLDRHNKIPKSHWLHADEFPTLFISEEKILNVSDIKETHEMDFKNPAFIKLLLQVLFDKGVYRLLIEGGVKTLKSFIADNLWNQAYIINTSAGLEEGIKAPNLHGELVNQWIAGSDNIYQVKNNLI